MGAINLYFYKNQADSEITSHTTSTYIQNLMNVKKFVLLSHQN